MRSDLAIYAEWCAGRGERPLPAQPETVAAFVDAMAEERAPATVRRYVASIVAAHKAVGLEEALKSASVRLALKRMHRKKGRRQGQAHGLTWPLWRRLMAAAGDRPIDDRNRALLAVAYDTMLRRAELVSLQASDLLEEMGGDATLLVRRSKTDREGRGAGRRCPRRRGSTSCASSGARASRSRSQRGRIACVKMRPAPPLPEIQPVPVGKHARR